MKKLIPFTCFLLLAVYAFSQDKCMPERPSPQRLVNNLSLEFSNFLSYEEEGALERKLVNFDNETSNQITIVILDDLCGYDASDFSTRLGHKWKVGQEKFDNGIVILIVPVGEEGRRDVDIAIGYGLEGAIPDITTKRIVENEIIPRFKNGDYYGALNASTDVLISLAKNEYSYKEYGGEKEDWRPFLIAVIIFIILGIYLSRKKGYTVSSGGGRAYYGGGWSTWGGGGFGGGSGGGGFGGFGGGGFGGGGAGGKW